MITANTIIEILRKNAGDDHYTEMEIKELFENDNTSYCSKCSQDQAKKELIT